MSGITEIRIGAKRKVSVLLRLTEEEAQVLSAGLYALEAFDPSWALDHEVQAFGEAMAEARESLQAGFREAEVLHAVVHQAIEAREQAMMQANMEELGTT